MLALFLVIKVRITYDNEKLTSALNDKGHILRMLFH